MAMIEHDLSTFNQDHLNQVAGLLADLHGGFLPLDVRYQGAAAALARVTEWTEKRICPVDGAPLSSVTRELGKQTVFTHENGYEHGDRIEQLRTPLP